MRRGLSRLAVAAAIVAALAAAFAMSGLGSAGAAGSPVVVGGARPAAPAISGAQVVWADYYAGNWDIFLYDGLSRRTTRLTDDPGDQTMPAVSGSRLAYVDYSGGNADIVIRDIPTGATTRIALSGDQTDPTISGDWVAWEDRSGLSSRVEARNLVSGVVYLFGAENAPAERPRIAGNVLVYEDHSLQYDGRTDPDVVAVDLSTGVSTRVAASTAVEYYAETDGLYVVWSEAIEGGYKIRGYDTRTREYRDLSDGPGEQTMPSVANGMVYWIHNTRGEPLHVDTYDYASRARAPYYTYSSSDVSAFSASGANVAWLETAGRRLRVRAVFNEGLTPLARVAAVFAPVKSFIDSFQLATLSTGGDTVAPVVASTSVRPGEQQVSKTAGVSVSFSEPLDPASVNGSTVRLVDAATGDPVPATVRYSALGSMVTVKPTNALADGAYTLAVDPGVRDRAGNALDVPMLVSFATASAAATDVAAPTPPALKGARVDGLGSVEVSWTASLDDFAISAYEVYRRATPMSKLDMTGAQKVSEVSSLTLSATVEKALDETDKAYTYYYVVVARDAGQHTSNPSANSAPNPHGTYSATANTVTCTRCHAPHGGALIAPKLGARSAEGCYRCHGGTTGDDTFGVASTMDSEGRFNDDSGAARGVPSGTGNDGWSIHRTETMSTNGSECDACHSPHRKSYDDNTTVSYGRLLRGAATYSTDAAPFGNGFCYECHGSGSLGAMNDVAGANTYDATGGSHEMTSTSADSPVHSEFNVFATPHAARSNGGELPKIQCLACHNEHASPNPALVDYRQSNTRARTYDQAGLCFACHSKSSAENAGASKQSSGTAPFTWNGRDTKSEFLVLGASGSRHPVTAGSGRWVTKTGTIFSQNTKPEFDVNGLGNFYQTLSNIADGNGSVVLSQYTPIIDPPATGYLFAAYPSGTGRFDSLLPGGTAWNADFNPTDIGANAQTGATAATKNGYIFALQGNSGTTMRYYEPPLNSGLGTWTASPAAFANSGAGSELVFDSTDDVIWGLAGGFTPTTTSSNIRRTTNFAGGALAWSAPGGANGPYFCTAANTPLPLGAGSTLAWAPANGTRPERLYAVNKSASSSRDGMLYFYDNPDAATGGTVWTSTTHALGTTGSNAGSRMAYFRIGGTDYLYFLRGGATAQYLLQLANTTAAAATVIENGTTNPWNAAIAEGASLTWNGDTTQAGFRLYAIRGTGTVGKVATWNGTTLVWADTPALGAASGAGSYLAFAKAELASYAGATVYNVTGTLQSSEISPSGVMTSWGALEYTSTTPAGTSVSVDVQGWNGSAWVTVATATSSPCSFGAVSVATYSKLRLIAHFATSDQMLSPRIDDWSITGATWDEWQTGSPGPAEWQSFSQNTKPEFDVNGLGNFYQTLSNIADGNGSVVLSQYTPIIDPPATGYLFAAYPSGTGRFDSLLPGGTAWNADFNPTDIGANAQTGATAATKNGYIFALQGNSGTTMRYYEPPLNSGLGTWTASPAAFANSGAGSELVFDSTDDVIWGLAGGFTPTTTSSNIRRTTNFAGGALAWSAPGGANGPYFCTAANTPLPLGAGSTLAWAPANGTRPERLYAVNKSASSSRDGMLYFYDNPDAATGGTVWTSTTHALGTTGSNAGSRMAYFRIGGTDYLYFLRGGATAQYLLQLANTTAAAATVIENGTTNPWNAAIAEGASLTWNGDTTQAGFRLYALRGSNTVGKVATWNGTTLVWADTPALGAASGAGSYLAFAKAELASYAGATVYNVTGSMQSSEISPYAEATTWGMLTYASNLPSGATVLSVKVQGGSGATWSDLATATVSPFDLSSFSVADYPRLRLVAQFATSDQMLSPRLDSWAVTSVYETWYAAGSVTCASCHNAHSVRRGGTGYWNVLRVSDPDNTNTPPADTTSFCLSCHDGTPPTATLSASVNVPYQVSFSSFSRDDAPLFPGWNKAAAGTAFTSSGHYTASAASGRALCETCHDPHASANRRLTAWTTPAGIVGGTGALLVSKSRANTLTADAFEENLCYKCHGSGTLPTGKASGAADVFTPAGLTYKHPISSVSGKHMDTEGPAQLGSANRHSECADCHNPHSAKPGIHMTGSSTAGEVLRGAVGINPYWGTANWTSAIRYSPQTILPGSGEDYEAYLCIKCHSSYSGLPFQVTTPSGTYTSTDLALEFNPANDSGHNVLGTRTNWPKETGFQSAAYTMTWPTNATFTAGWSRTSKLTCSSCHTYSAGNARGPHGSTARMLIDSAYPAPYQNAQLGDTDMICAKCHGDVAGINDGHVSDHGGSDGRCIACHIKVPHGWKRPRLLGYTTDPEPYRSLNLTGITAKDYSDGSWSENDCGQTGCGTHSSRPSGTLWP